MALFFNVTCFTLATVVFLRILDRYCMPKQASNEPPIVKLFIPYVAYIVGLIRHGNLLSIFEVWVQCRQTM